MYKLLTYGLLFWETHDKGLLRSSTGQMMINGSEIDEAMERFERYKPVLCGEDSSLKSELDAWIAEGIQEHGDENEIP